VGREIQSKRRRGDPVYKSTFWKSSIRGEIYNWRRTNAPEGLRPLSQALGDTLGGRIGTLRRGRGLFFAGITSDTLHKKSCRWRSPEAIKGSCNSRAQSSHKPLSLCDYMPHQKEPLEKDPFILQQTRRCWNRGV
jgi:hypothetical protein